MAGGDRGIQLQIARPPGGGRTEAAMGKRIRQLIMTGAVLYGLYCLMAYHFIFFGRNVPEVLKKSKLTLTHTFYSPGDRKEIQYKGLDTILRNDDLRQAGLGELLLERGLITEEELKEAEDRIDYGG